MKTRSGKKIQLTSYEELLSVPTIEGASDIPLEQLHEFKNHPFHVVEDEAMMELVESIKTNGILSPAIARRRPEGGFELVSGHRRRYAAKLAGLDKMPVFVKDLSDDEATIIMVDANIQREEILPSERAFAFKMKMEAMSHQGSSSGQVGPKLTVEEIGKDSGVSARQVKRYIRLTELIPELLELLDRKKLKFTVAHEISFLPPSVQSYLYVYLCGRNKLTLVQISRIRRIRNFDDMKEVEKILYEKSGTIKQVYFSLTETQISSYFPEGYTMQQMEEVILTLLDEWSRKEKG